MKQPQFVERSLLDARRKPLHGIAEKQRRSAFVSEAFDHKARILRTT